VECSPKIGPFDMLGFPQPEEARQEKEPIHSPETLHELERIKLHRRSLAKPRNVAVANYV
jgi:hypothetical protein